MRVKINKFATSIQFDFDNKIQKLKAKDFSLDMSVFDKDMEYLGRIASEIDTVNNLIQSKNSNIQKAASQFLADSIDSGLKGNPKARMIVIVTKDMRDYKAIPFSAKDRDNYIVFSADAQIVYNKILSSVNMPKDIDRYYLKKALVNKLSV